MINIAPEAWRIMIDHAQKAYPDECCGAMIGRSNGETKMVLEAVPLDNAFGGEKRARYELRPADLLAADRAARERSLDLIGIFHSHPDCDAYFSKTDLENSCPWYSFVVLAVKNGVFDHARSFLPNMEQTAAPEEELTYP